MSHFIKTTLLAASTIAVGLSCISVAQAQSPAVLYGRTYNYIDTGTQCVTGACQSFNQPGKIQILRGGKILYYFGKGTNFGNTGLGLELNRTVSLGRGRVPPGFTLRKLIDVRSAGVPPQLVALGDLPLRRGSGTVTYDGRQVRAVISTDFNGRLRGGTARGTGQVQIQYDYAYDVDPAGNLVGGRGSISGGGSINSDQFSGSSTLSGNSVITPVGTPVASR